MLGNLPLTYSPQRGLQIGELRGIWSNDDWVEDSL